MRRLLLAVLVTSVGLAGCSGTSDDEDTGTDGDTGAATDVADGTSDAGPTDTGGADTGMATDTAADDTSSGDTSTTDTRPDPCEQPDPDGPDSDSDGIIDQCDNCKSIANADQADGDGDGTGDACQGLADPNGDADNDRNPNGLDNCPETSNARQADGDGDRVGDACDNCPEAANADQSDSNDDGTGDACDDLYDARRDSDADDVPDIDDNCPQIKNAAQKDDDGDALGNPCDNCPKDANHQQADGDMDGTGDACEKKPAGKICKRQSRGFRHLKPNVVIAFDHSGSMIDVLPSAKSAADSLVDNLYRDVRFGVVGFNSSCTPPRDLAVDAYTQNNGAAVKNAYGSVSASGSAGVRGAIAEIQANKWYQNASSSFSNKRYKAVVLFHEGSSGDCGGNAGARSAVSKLYQNDGVETFVVGLTGSSSTDTQQLNQLADQGNTDAGAAGDPRYYEPSNIGSLATELKKKTKKTIACSYKVNPPAPSKIWVKIHGNFVSDDSFQYDPNTNQLSLDSTTCKQLRNTSSSSPLEIVFGCASECMSSGMEACNYTDDDCDRQVDEGCQGCLPETCDDRNNDCDDEVDEGCPDDDACIPVPETCDGKDNDCDDEVDEGCP